MKLSRYDGECVRVTDADGNVFEGACEYCTAEFCEAEIGRCEEALNIDNWMFFASDVRSVREIGEDDARVWMSRTLHRARIDPTTFEMLERQSDDETVTVRCALPDGVREGDAIRFESEDDDTDVVYVAVRSVRRDGGTADAEVCAL
jgi:hypothetical protein